MEELLVGNEPCTYLAICEVLASCTSAGVFWTRLEALARRLGYPEDRVMLITPWLLNKTRTHDLILYEILDAWRGKKSSDAKLTTFINTLELMGLQDCADALRKEFKINSQDVINVSNSMDYKVSFQGSKVSLREVLEDLPVEKIQKLNEKFQIYSLRPQLHIAQSVPQPLKYYIPRRLKTRCHLDTSLFDQTGTDVFIIRNIQLHELSRLTKEQGVDFSSNQLDSLSTRFIVLKHPQDFNTICKMTTSSVHLIEYNDGQFTWIKSQGSLSLLQRYLSNMQKTLDDEEFIRFSMESSLPICISDTPGMGKTILMASIAHHIMKIHPGRLVMFFVLSEFIQKVTNEAQAKDKTFLVDLIKNYISESEFGHEVATALLLSERPLVYLFFDGYDEVLDNQVNIAKLVLETISQMPSVKLYVSTRPHLRDELENIIGALGYNILPFGEDEQIRFLTQYWGAKNEGMNGRVVHIFARKCLEKLNETMNDLENEIAGIPLQCMLLAEVYQDEAIKYSDLKTEGTDINTEFVIRITSIFEMFKKLIDMKLEKTAIPTKVGCWKRIFRWSRQDQIKYITKVHMYAALQLIFPWHVSEFRYTLATPSEVEVRELCALGILEKKDTVDATPRFVHRTFAEYLLGLFIARMLTMHPGFDRQIFRRGTFLDFVFNTALGSHASFEYVLHASNIGMRKQIKSFRFNHPVLSYFVNAHLTCILPQCLNHKAWTKNVYKLHRFLNSCVTHDYPNLFKQVIHQKYVQQYVYRTDFSDLLFLGAKFCSYDFLKLLHQQALQNPNYIAPCMWSRLYGFQIKLLHVAVERGNFVIADYIVKSLHISEINKLKFVIHCCVSDTLNVTGSVLSQKIEIVSLFSKINKHWITEFLLDDTIPLLTSNVHPELIKTLVFCGADVPTTNAENENLLHILAKRGYHDTILHLLQLGAFSDGAVAAKTKAGLTPFQVGLAFGKGLSLAIINMMEERGMEVSGKLASETLKLLLCNRNIAALDLNNDFVQVVDYLIEKDGIITCSNGLTPWKLEATKRNLKSIQGSIHSNAALLKELQKREILTAPEVETYIEQPDKLLERLQATNETKTYEALCVSLVACSQIQPFLLLTKSLQSYFQDLVFLTPPAGLFEAISSSPYKVVVLVSWDMKVSLVRLNNMIDRNITIIDSDDLSKQVLYSNLIAVTCETATKKTIQELNTFANKFVCLCKYVQADLGNCVIIPDKFSWEDLSTEFQQELKNKMLSEFEFNDHEKWKLLKLGSTKFTELDSIKVALLEYYKLTDIVDDFSAFNTELLIEFIKTEKSIIFEIGLVKPITTDKFLANNSVRYFLLEKPLFPGISLTTKDADYFIVKNYHQFKNIFKKQIRPVHLISNEGGGFKLVRSIGLHVTSKWSL